MVGLEYIKNDLLKEDEKILFLNDSVILYPSSSRSNMEKGIFILTEKKIKCIKEKYKGIINKKLNGYNTILDVIFENIDKIEKSRKTKNVIKLYLKNNRYKSFAIGFTSEKEFNTIYNNIENKIQKKASKTRCIECSQEIPRGVLFCTNCGAKQSIETRQREVRTKKTEEKPTELPKTNRGIWGILGLGPVVWGIKEKPRFIIWNLLILGAVFIITFSPELSEYSPSLSSNLSFTGLFGLIPFFYLRRMYNNSLKTQQSTNSEPVLEEDNIKLNIIWGLSYSPKLTFFSFLWIILLFISPLWLFDYNYAYDVLADSFVLVSLFGLPILWLLGFVRKRSRDKKIKLINEKQGNLENLRDNAYAIVNSAVQIDISDMAKKYNLTDDDVFNFFKEKKEKDGLKIRLTDDGKIISDYVIIKKIKEKIL
jgi:hypothetical protein